MVHNELQKKLIQNFKKLIPCIEGPWVMSDGALLGHLRERGMIKDDDDIDIYFLPGTKINMDKLKETGLAFSKYYICDKIYDPNDPQVLPKNKWKEFLDYSRTLPEHEGFNRFELLKASKHIYKNEYIEPKHSKPWIDIMYLEKYENDYYYPYNFKHQNFIDYIKYDSDCFKFRQKITFEGVKDVYIPCPPLSVLLMRDLYGPLWWKRKDELNENNVVKINHRQ